MVAGYVLLVVRGNNLFTMPAYALVDPPTLLLLFIFSVPVLIASGLWKDLFRAFKADQSSLINLKRTLEAVKLMQRQIFYTGSVLITLLMAFPIFILVMRIWGKLPRFHMKGTASFPLRKYLVCVVLAIIPMLFLWGIEIFLIRYGQISQENIISFTPENMTFTLVFNCFLLPVMEEISLATGLVLAHMAVKAKGILPTIIFHIGINLLGQVILPLFC